jgi:signal transduction histidine kinase
VENNRFRRAAVDRSAGDRLYLLDYAGEAMRLTGISMLQIQDGSGRIVSSGHFRNEYDRLEPELPRLLAAAPDGISLVRARAPDGPFVALARIDSCRMGGEPFYFVAGVRVGEPFLRNLVRDAELSVSLEGPGGVLLTPAGSADTTGPENRGDEGEIVRVLAVPFIDGGREGLASARIRVVHPLTGLRELHAGVNRWFLVAVVVTCVLAVLLSTWLASRISRPLVDLADKTSRLDLERLDVRFATGRNDEIGVLSRMLDAMTGRLRASALHIKDAERRATLGELARQVNHDIKNGLTPIRNVFRHLAELGRDKPADMPGVFEERKQTLDSSIAYLEDLATNYARLGKKSERRRCDLDQIVRRVALDLQSADGSYEIRTELDGGAVNGDPVALRRVLENLVSNAIDSLESRPGRVTVTTSGAGGDRVRIEVADTGRGMTSEQQSRVFDDFYTTKETGTGLGLSIVRRMVMDLDGSIRVDSSPGGGSRFVVEIPAAPGPE